MIAVPHAVAQLYPVHADLVLSGDVDYEAAERARGVRAALDLILAGRRGRAFYELTRSVTAQARMAGLPGSEVPGCPCGRRHPSPDPKDA